MMSGVDLYKQNSQRERRLIPKLISLIEIYEDDTACMNTRYEAIEKVTRILEHVCILMKTHSDTGQILYSAFLNVLTKAAKATTDLHIKQKFTEEKMFLNYIRGDR